MATLCKTYPSEVMARRAVDALRAADVPGRDVRLLTGCRAHDVRREPVGGFAGAVGPDAPVGTFANVPHPRRRGAGSFAGDPDRQRQGSFADTDRTVIVSYDGGAEHARMAGEPAVRGLMEATGVAGDAADRIVDELHAGRATVLAEVAAIAPGDARARLDELAHVA
jgi:hypothetical protein